MASGHITKQAVRDVRHALSFKQGQAHANAVSGEHSQYRAEDEGRDEATIKLLACEAAYERGRARAFAEACEVMGQLLS